MIDEQGNVRKPTPEQMMAVAGKIRERKRRADEWMCERCWAWNDASDEVVCHQCEAPKGTPE